MSKFENVKHQLANKGMVDRKTFSMEEVKEFVNTYTGNSLSDNYSVEDYLVEYLKENTIRALLDIRFIDAECYCSVVSEEFKDY